MQPPAIPACSGPVRATDGRRTFVAEPCLIPTARVPLRDLDHEFMFDLRFDGIDDPDTLEGAQLRTIGSTPSVGSSRCTRTGQFIR